MENVAQFYGIEKIKRRTFSILNTYTNTLAFLTNVKLLCENVVSNFVTNYLKWGERSQFFIKVGC